MADTPVFHVTSTGTGSPATINLTASLLGISGTVAFSAFGALVTPTGNTATLAFSSMSGATATVTATVISSGVTYTATVAIAKVLDGAPTATPALYQWKASQPLDPSGSSTYTWATGVHSAYTGGNNWAVAIPANPGIAGYLLWVASKATTSTGAPTSTVSWASGFGVQTLAQNGANGTPGSDGTDGTNGTNGTNGNKYATSYLYQWSATTPGNPTGTSTFTWATGASSAYSGAAGWSNTPPANPGTPGLQLWTATKAVSDVATATTSTVSWASGFAVQAVSANGAAGTTGTPGTRTAMPTVYQWAATIPAGPSGSPTYTWSTGLFGAAPAGWALTPGTSPSPGYTLWAAKVTIIDATTAATTGFSWTGASISAAGYAGTSGGPGQAGASYCLAYTDVTGGVGALATSPATSTRIGQGTMPTTGTWGETVAWTTTVPTIAAGHSLWQTDGIYSPATGNTVWGVPYLSSLKVGSLSAISANLGTINAGSLTAVTIVASSFQTAATAKRVEINYAASNSVVCYNTSGAIIAELGGGSTSAAVYGASSGGGGNFLGLSGGYGIACSSNTGQAVLASSVTGQGINSQCSGAGTAGYFYSAGGWALDVASAAVSPTMRIRNTTNGAAIDAACVGNGICLYASTGFGGTAGSFSAGGGTSWGVSASATNGVRSQATDGFALDATSSSGGVSTIRAVQSGSHAAALFSSSGSASSVLINSFGAAHGMYVDVRGTGQAALFDNHLGTNVTAISAIAITGGNAVMAVGMVTPYVDNGYSLGNQWQRWTTVWAANGVIQTSDARTKTEVVDCPYGLALMDALRPVAYKMLVGQNNYAVVPDSGGTTVSPAPGVNLQITPRAGIRTHLGLISQELKLAIGDEDLAMWVLTDKSDPTSEQALIYTELIPPMIKAIQELHALVKGLQAEVALLKASK